MPITPRLHLFEICDQPWCPDYFRHMVQTCLTLAWRFRVPIVQPQSPASLAAKLLYEKLGSEIRDYTYVDFCAGAGGPTPYIERHLNKTLEEGNGVTATFTNGTINEPVKFVLTDLYPHIPEWEMAVKKSKGGNLSYISKPIDATNAPKDLLVAHEGNDRKVFRMFNLAFHHFDDELAKKILKNTLETADGFAIFELQERTLSSLLMIFLLGILTIFITPFQFPPWRYPGQFFWSCIIPVVPFILVFDGLVSSLRTRTPKEVLQLLKSCGADGEGWETINGHEMHTFPIGYLTWSIGMKRSGKRWADVAAEFR